MRNPKFCPHFHVIFVTIIGCASPESITDTTTTSTDNTVTTLTTTTFTTPTHDYDSDGFFGDKDCDDYNPDVYPGAEEVFDEVDNDCDGRVDADGLYRGEWSLDFTAVYKGVEYDRTANCEAELNRYGEASIAFEINCDGTQLDEMGELLIGALLTITPSENANVAAEKWSGTVEFSSSDGWSSSGEGSAVWSDMTTLTLNATMTSFSLDATGSGTLSYPKN